MLIRTVFMIAKSFDYNSRLDVLDLNILPSTMLVESASVTLFKLAVASINLDSFKLFVIEKDGLLESSGGPSSYLEN